jgi:hypothetical protein
MPAGGNRRRADNVSSEDMGARPAHCQHVPGRRPASLEALARKAHDDDVPFRSRIPAMPDDRQDEFAAAVLRAGVTIPAERWEAMREAYFSMQALLKVLDDPFAYEDEPGSMPRYDREAP